MGLTSVWDILALSGAPGRWPHTAAVGPRVDLIENRDAHHVDKDGAVKKADALTPRETKSYSWGNAKSAGGRQISSVQA
jgi:hypothetical protein